MDPLAVLSLLASTFMHAGWNLMAHHRRQSSTLFVQLLLVIGLLGIGPVIVAQITSFHFPLAVWGLASLSGIFLAIYYLGLMKSYRSGDFGLVYPVARALPVLLLAAIDCFRGWPPSLIGWLGLAMVVTGCLLAPQKSLRGLNIRQYMNATFGWILLTAFATAAYSIFDKMATGHLPAGRPMLTAQYAVLEYLLAAPLLWIALKLFDRHSPGSKRFTPWTWPAIAAALLFGAYWLVLLAYQLTPYTSYVVAMRQFSIVLGAIGAALIFHESMSRLRCLAILLLTAGVVVIALGTRH